MSEVIPLCNSADLKNGDLAVPFDVIYGGQTAAPLPFALMAKSTLT